ncbi:single-stranded DNA-binding protein, partial [Weissella confusa]
MNHVSLIGRLTKEPDVKYTTSGAAVASGTIAVNRDFTNANGERESDFINFVIWRKAAENFVNMTAKGSQIGLEGSWQTRSYENQQGQRVYVSELVVSNFTLVETKEQTEQRKGQSA